MSDHYRWCHQNNNESYGYKVVIILHLLIGVHSNHFKWHMVGNKCDISQGVSSFSKREKENTKDQCWKQGLRIDQVYLKSGKKNMMADGSSWRVRYTILHISGLSNHT